LAYLTFDLDAKKKVGPAARAAGVDPGVIAWGLLELWEHVWTTKSAEVPELVLDGCFGPSNRIRDALAAYGFLEPKTPNLFRVRGAERYLRISEAKSRAGKARAAAGARGSDGRLLVQHPPAPAGEPASEKPALPPTTNHQPPLTEHHSPTTTVGGGGGEDDCDPVQDAPAAPPAAPDAWRRFQALRVQREAWRSVDGIRSEYLEAEVKQPKKFVEWWEDDGSKHPTIFRAYGRFLLDDTFAAKQWPFQVFMHPNVWEARL
jgi:hypothetical protein